MATYISENFDAVTPPAMPASLPSVMGSVVTSSALARSSPNALLCSGSGAYVCTWNAAKPSTSGGDVRLQAAYRMAGTPTSTPGFVLWPRQFAAPTSQTFGYGYRVALFPAAGFAAVEFRLGATLIHTYQPTGFAAAFSPSDWYVVTVDTVGSLDRLGTIFTLTVKRDSDGKYLVPSGSGVAWVAAQAATPLHSYYYADGNPPCDGLVTGDGSGIALFGAYCPAGSANNVAVDDCLFQDAPYPTAYAGSPPADEVEWLLSAGPVTSGVGTGSVANLYDGDSVSSAGALTSAASEGYLGIDLGPGVAGVLSRVQWAPYRGVPGTSTYDQLPYLNTFEGSSSSAGPWSAVGAVPGQAWFAGTLNDTRVDHTPANAYRYFRVRNPWGVCGYSELYFCGSRVGSWRPVRPTITPGAGRYAAGKSVTVATTTAGASLYYTTDGTTPTLSGGVPQGTTTPYTGPLSVPSTASGATWTVKAVAYHAGGTTATSAVVSAEFRPAEFVPSTGSTRFGTSNVWPSDWYDDRGRLIEAHYSAPFYDAATSTYYWLGMPLCYGCPEQVSSGVFGYSSTDLYNWTFLGQVCPPPPVAFKPDGTTPANATIRPHVLVNPSPSDPNKKYVLAGKVGVGPTYPNGRLAIATAPAAAGPYTWRAMLRPNDASGSPTEMNDQVAYYEPATGKAWVAFGALLGYELDPATDWTSFRTANAVPLGSGPSTEAPALFAGKGAAAGNTFAVQSVTTSYGSNTGTADAYKSNTSVSALSGSGGGITLWASAPAPTDVPYHAQPNGAFEVAGRDGVVLCCDFGDPGDTSGLGSTYELFRTRHVWYPLAPSAFTGAFAVAAPTPAAWDLTSFPSSSVGRFRPSRLNGGCRDLTGGF